MYLDDAREEVFSTLLEIPEILLQAERKVETYDGDRFLYDKTELLYVAVLRALESAINWLTQNPFGKTGTTSRKAS
jgi:hypothetical protein